MSSKESNKENNSLDKDKLGKTLWNIADKLRGSMDADDFKDYMLGILFFRYLSARYLEEAKKLYKQKTDNDVFIKYLNTQYQDKVANNIADFEEEIKKRIYYIIQPEYLWENIINLAKTQNKNTKTTLEKAFKNIENSAFSGAKEDFDGLFSEIDLSSRKLGKDYSEQNKQICDILVEINKGITGFSLNNDNLGDAYEYLIGQFAANSGKKAGEFFTPSNISEILAEIVCLDSQDSTKVKANVTNILDFACGSGSLLLKVNKKLNPEHKEQNKNSIKIYGQEKNLTTYNLARMNMLLHGVNPLDSTILHGDTLLNEHAENLQDIEFDAIVANPPFSLRWEIKEDYTHDVRFKDYEVAPKSAADFAFLLHGIYYLKDGGSMAIILPHGVLFRGGKEEKIRRNLLEKNSNGYIDAIIGLPEKLFYNTGIPVCIIVLKKCRKNEDILFINAQKEFEKGKRQNQLNKNHIEKILNTYKQRQEIDKFSKKVSLEEIKKNDFNLNITRYISTAEEEEAIDLAEVHKEIKQLEATEKEIDAELNKYLKELNLETL